jgi:hypothetical protein
VVEVEVVAEEEVEEVVAEEVVVVVEEVAAAQTHCVLCSCITDSTENYII